MKRILTGDRPTGKLHLGHFVGTLKNRVELQNQYETFLIVADLHTLTTKPDKEYTEKLKENIYSQVIDYLAVGIDPDKVSIYIQSQIPEVAELAIIFGMLTTVPRLDRMPTLKEVMNNAHITTPSYGLLGYPVLQSADILMVRADLVPVGKDQLPHLEVGREVVRRFNHLYGAGKQILVEPQATLSEFSEIPGIDGRKMSKSYNNAILLADDEQTTTQKVRSMVTDPQKVRRNDPGHPEVCPVFALWKLVKPQHVAAVETGCRSGALGCVQDKGDFAEALNEHLRPLRERRAEIVKDMGYVERVIAEGTKKAQAVAAETLHDVRAAMKLL